MMSEWISVKDRLPEGQQRVLTWDGNRIASAQYTNELPDGGGWYYTADECRFKSELSGESGEIIYWLPLPEPPKSEPDLSEEEENYKRLLLRDEAIKPSREFGFPMCPLCRELILSDFNFCPNCGQRMKRIFVKEVRHGR